LITDEKERLLPKLRRAHCLFVILRTPGALAEEAETSRC